MRVRPRTPAAVAQEIVALLRDDARVDLDSLRTQARDRARERPERPIR